MMTTALEPNELIREIQIPVKTGKFASAYLKMAQKASGFAICGVAAVVELDASGSLSNVAVGITGVGSYVFRRLQDGSGFEKGVKPTAELLMKACEKASDGIIAMEDLHVLRQITASIWAGFSAGARCKPPSNVPAKMKIEGQFSFGGIAPLAVWNFLTDGSRISECLPGCQKLEPTAEGSYDLQMRFGIGAISGVFAVLITFMICGPLPNIK